jgi:drug/metabolite transporter (DMT)-like permease
VNQAGILFALLTTISWSIGLFPFTQAARSLGVNPLNHFRLVLAAFFILILNLLLFPKEFFDLFTSDYTSAWLWLGLSGIIGLTIGDYFAFAMYSILGARVGSVLTTFAPTAALILGGILIDEHINYIGIIGIAITILGVNYISLGKSEIKTVPDHGHGSIGKGIITGILAALCQGAGLVLAKKGMLAEADLHRQIQPLGATFIRLTIGVTSLFILTFLQRNFKAIWKPIRENKDNGIKYAVAGTIFGPTLGVSLSLYTVSLIDPSVAQTIFSLVPAVTMLFAVAIFGDKLTSKSILGLIVALAGVIILIWREKIILFL